MSVQPGDRYVAVDRKTLKPGCVLIQAVLGGDRELLMEHFDDDDWEVGNFDNMAPLPEAECALGAEARRKIRAES